MQKKSKIILGIDPGLEKTGFGVIEVTKNSCISKDFGIFITRKTSSLPKRLCQIREDFEEIIHMWKPDLIAVEKLVFVKNVTSGLLVAQARGIILERSEFFKIPIQEFLPTAVKKAVTGNGGAPKLQIQTMVQKILSLDALPEPDDAADALAIALTAT